MKPARHVIGLAALAAVLMVAGVKASDPVGVYAMVERVVLSPSDSAPTSAQIWGAFVPAITPPSRTYKPEEAYGQAAKGYMYFTCAAGKASVCDAEWHDLKAMAGKSEVVGFGTRWAKAKPRVRPATEVPVSPDVYETNIGVVKIGRYGDYPSLVASLKAAMKTAAQK